MSWEVFELSGAKIFAPNSKSSRLKFVDKNAGQKDRLSSRKFRFILVFVASKQLKCPSHKKGLIDKNTCSRAFGGVGFQMRGYRRLILVCAIGGIFGFRLF